jgi:hypothetical protein
VRQERPRVTRFGEVARAAALPLWPAFVGFGKDRAGSSLMPYRTMAALCWEFGCPHDHLAPAPRLGVVAWQWWARARVLPTPLRYVAPPTPDVAAVRHAGTEHATSTRSVLRCYASSRGACCAGSPAPWPTTTRVVGATCSLPVAILTTRPTGADCASPATTGTPGLPNPGTGSARGRSARLGVGGACWRGRPRVRQGRGVEIMAGDASPTALLGPLLS